MLWAIGPAPAQERSLERGVFLTTALSGVNDSNVLRLPDGVKPSDLGVPSDKRSDFYYAPMLKLDAIADISRQRITANVSGQHTRFEELTQYNSRNVDYGVNWLWAAGHDFTGELRGAQVQQNTNFEDFRGRQRNVLTILSKRALLNYQPRPDRRATVSIDEYDGTNSLPQRSTSDYLVRVMSAEIVALAPAGTELGLIWRNTDGNYPNQVILPLAPIDNSFVQDDVEFLWRRFDNRLKGELRLGYGKRRYPNVPDRNFEGPTYFAALVYEATGRLSVNLNAARDLNATDDFDNLYAITDRWQVQAQYSLTPKVLLLVARGDRDVSYRGDPDNFLNNAQGERDKREDRTRDTSASLVWAPRNRWRLSLAYIRQERDSNRPRVEYRTEMLQLDVSYRIRLL